MLCESVCHQLNLYPFWNGRKKQKMKKKKKDCFFQFIAVNQQCPFPIFHFIYIYLKNEKPEKWNSTNTSRGKHKELTREDTEIVAKLLNYMDVRLADGMMCTNISGNLSQLSGAEWSAVNIHRFVPRPQFEKERKSGWWVDKWISCWKWK